MAKKISLGVPPPPGLDQGAGGGGPAAPPPSPGGGDGGLGASEDLGAAQGAQEPPMDYPELHASGLPAESGIDQLPEEGDAHMHYKVTSRGKRTVKHGPDKGKEKHDVSMEIHHMTPLGGGSKSGSAQGDSDNEIRDSAKKFFESEDQGGGEEEAPPMAPPKKKKPPTSENMSQMPG